MSPTTGGFLAVCLLLAGAGLIKLRRPAAATRIMMELNLPGWPAVAGWPVARLLGLIEIAVAVSAVWSGGRWAAAAVTVAYLVFAGVAARLVATAPDSDCGCFGSTPSPLTGVHVAVDLAFAAIAGLGLSWPPTGAGNWSAAGLPATIGLLLAGVVLAGLGYLLFTTFPALLRERLAVTA